MTAAIPKVSFGAPTFRIKQKDTQPSITYTTVDQNQQLVPITGASGVLFRYRLQSDPSSKTVSRTAVIVDAANGLLRYDFTLADTVVAGSYYGEWIVQFPNNGQQTFPVRGFQSFVVEADLAA